MIYIYQIFGSDDKEPMYFGQTRKNPKYRFDQHMNSAKSPSHHSLLYKSMRNKLKSGHFLNYSKLDEFYLQREADLNEYVYINIFKYLKNTKKSHKVLYNRNWSEDARVRSRRLISEANADRITSVDGFNSITWHRRFDTYTAHLWWRAPSGRLRFHYAPGDELAGTIESAPIFFSDMAAAVDARDRLRYEYIRKGTQLFLTPDATG